MTSCSRVALLGGMAAMPLVAQYVRSEPIPMDATARLDAPGDFVQLRHGITHYVAAGPEDGEPLVFLSGATLSLWMWDGLFERLAAAGYRAIRFDRYGMGFSDRPEVAYDQELFEDQIVDLLDALGVKRPVTLLGVAFAGPIVAQFALNHPERIASVCLVSPDGFATPLNLGLRLAMIPGVGLPFFEIFGTRALKARVPGYSANPRIVKRIESRLYAELRYKGFKRALISAIEHLPIHGGENLYRLLNLSGTRTMLLWGRTDPVTPMPPEDVVRDVFSNADIRLLDGIGHMPHFEDLQLTADSILEFLRMRHDAAAEAA